MFLKRQERLYEQVYEFLWSKLLDGEISASAPIRDAEWADRLNVSRTPVREALRKFEHEGIIEAQDNGRYQVREFKASDVRKLYRCRAALEGITAFEAASRITARALKRLKSLVDRTESAVGAQNDKIASTCNTEFHDIIINVSENDHAARLLAFLRRTILFSRFSVLSKTNENTLAKQKYVRHVRAVIHDHRQIIAALEARDPELAEVRMREHLCRTSDDMAAIVQSDRNDREPKTLTHP